tara:strand:- start:65 stop:505 length:441 start_codon:yes stop_codon:yes gene_type:complete
MEIPNHPNYLIYPDGKVFSKKTNKFKTLSDNGLGYKYVALYPNQKNYYIHRLIAEYYIPNPNNLKEVDHINRIKDDNRIENLRWVTRKENENNKGIQKRNKTGFKYIGMRGDSYKFSRKNCKIKSSKNLSKLLCYSFFYLLKHPLQ